MSIYYFLIRLRRFIFFFNNILNYRFFAYWDSWFRFLRPLLFFFRVTINFLISASGSFEYIILAITEFFLIISRWLIIFMKLWFFNWNLDTIKIWWLFLLNFQCWVNTVASFWVIAIVAVLILRSSSSLLTSLKLKWAVLLLLQF